MSAAYDPEHITYFAETDYRSQKQKFGIKSRDRTRHMYVIGKSGVGKSTLLENMAIQDIEHGEGVAVLDPHGSFAEKMLEYIPMSRIKDVVYFAPFDSNYPISFNVLEDVGADKRHFVASGLMSTFKKIWVDAWSARMEYILNNILLALLEYPNSTLLGVNRMLSDKVYRNKVVDNITDPGVKAFWVEEFAKYGDRYMQEAGAAIQNKIGQLTANPLIRNIIGQPKSSFDIRDVMDNQKILVINLSKGRIGEQNTSLLGSMIITKIYLGAMSRAEVPVQQMAALPNFYFYVDEFQSFANETFADILAEARKYKLALIIAHQYVAQMEEKVRDAVFGNVGTTVSFRVGPLDGELLEKVMSPQFTQNDLVNLGMAQIYLTLMINDIGSNPFSARTLPPLPRPTISHRDDVIEYTRESYASPKEDVENAIRGWYDDGPKAEPREPRESRSSGEPREPRELRAPKEFSGPTSQAPRGDRKPYSQQGNDSRPRDKPWVASEQRQLQQQQHQPFKKALSAQDGHRQDPDQAFVPVSVPEPVLVSQHPVSSAAITPAIRPVQKKPQIQPQPQRSSESQRSSEPRQSFSQRPPAADRSSQALSQTLSGLLDSLDGSNPASSSETSVHTMPSLRDSVTEKHIVPKPPFAGEKTLRDSISPVKLAERGPSQQNKDLLKAALAKATAGPRTPAPIPAPSQSQNHPQSRSVPIPPPIATDTSQKEIDYQSLKKVLE